jgi:hypothetical protein
LGIRTWLDLATADRRLIRELLTASGEALWWALNGDPVPPIQTQRMLHRIISRGGSFGEPTNMPVALWAWLVRNLERLVEELAYHRILTGHIAVWIGYRDSRAGEGRASQAVPTDRFDLLLDSYRPRMRRAWIPGALASRMHDMAALKHLINARHGRFALRSAATLPLGAIYADRAYSYDICDVHGKTCF